jgi:DNA-binding MarR family transcriptional regulator
VVNDYLQYGNPVRRRTEAAEAPLTPAPGNHRLLPELAVLPGHLAWRAAGRVTAALGEYLPVGVDIHGYAVLLALAGRTTRSQQELSRMVAVSRTTVSKVAADLVAQGLVERVRNPADRRSYLLERTAEGAAAARRWRRHAEDVEDAITAGFSVEEKEELRRLLFRVVEEDLSPETPDALLDSIGFLVTRTQFRMHRDFLAGLEPLGLEPRHFGALTALQALGPVPQAELARNLGVSGAHVVALVDDLEERGLVERRRLPADRRSQVLHLLPGAAERVAQAGRLAEASAADRLAPLSIAERQRLTELLRRFVTAP